MVCIEAQLWDSESKRLLFKHSVTVTFLQYLNIKFWNKERRMTNVKVVSSESFELEYIFLRQMYG